MRHGRKLKVSEYRRLGKIRDDIDLSDHLIIAVCPQKGGAVLYELRSRGGVELTIRCEKGR